MFQSRKLIELQRRKELLVSQCDASRALLAIECRRLKSPRWWLGEAGRLARTHPLLLAGVGLGAGALAARLAVRPRSMAAPLRLAGYALPAAFRLWRAWRKAA